MFYEYLRRKIEGKKKEFIRTGHEFELQICKSVWYINVWMTKQK